MTLVIRDFRTSSCIIRLGSTNKQDCRSLDREDRYSRRKETYLENKIKYNKIYMKCPSE
jgi:hypothetical protein